MSTDDAQQPRDRSRRHTESLAEIRRRRRLAVLLEMASWGGRAGSPEEGSAAAMRVLARRPHDLRFGLVYLFDAARSEARLTASMGQLPAGLPSPERVDLAHAAPWSLAEVARTEVHRRLDDIADDTTAFVLPLPPDREHRAIGALVLGTDPRSAEDPEHIEFQHHIAVQLTRATTMGRRTQELDAVLRRNGAEDSMADKRDEVSTLLAALRGRRQAR